MTKRVINTSCFENFQSINLTTVSKLLNSSERINCFEWDSLEVGKRDSFKNYPCIKFHQICKKNCGNYLGKELSNHMDWLDGDKNWTFIYFYENGKKLNVALAFPESPDNFYTKATDKLIREKTFQIKHTQSESN